MILGIFGILGILIAVTLATLGILGILGILIAMTLATLGILVLHPEQLERLEARHMQYTPNRNQTVL